MAATQHLEGLARKAMQMYKMVQEGDRICVAVSGGKDSVALALALSSLRRYYDCSFNIHALTIDPCFFGKPTDYSAITAALQQEGIAHSVRRSNIGTVVFETRKEKNPCALCANLRRGMLHTAAKELQCNKIALGHHLDDAIETLFMNLFGQGQMTCFSPVTWLSRKQITMIRPLVLASEQDVQKAAQQKGFPVVKNACPVEGQTQRAETKARVHAEAERDKAFRRKMLNALQTGNISGWGKVL